MTKKSDSAGAKPSDGTRFPKTTRPRAAQFFDQLTSHSQPTCLPPPSNVTSARDNAGAKRRALATDDDDIAMFAAECAPLEAERVRGPTSSLRSLRSAGQDTTDIPPGDDDYFARALAPASIPRHFRGLPWDDKRLRRRRGVDPSSDSAADDVPSEPVSRHASTNFRPAPPTPTDASHFQFFSGSSQVPPALTPAMPPRTVGARLATLHTEPERADTTRGTCDSISAIQSLYGVSSDPVTAPSVFSDHSDHRDAARSRGEPNSTANPHTRQLRADTPTIFPTSDILPRGAHAHSNMPSEHGTPFRSAAPALDRSRIPADGVVPATADDLVPDPGFKQAATDLIAQYARSQ